MEEFIQVSQPHRRLRVPVDHGAPRVQKLRADGRRRPSPEIQPGAFPERGGSGIVVPGEGVLHLSGQDLQGIGAGLLEAVQM